MFAQAIYVITIFAIIECTHIFTLERDFSKLSSDPELTKHVQEIVNKLKTFKLAVHPRVRLFYQLLKRGMADYAHRTADSLYHPDVYRKNGENAI